MTLSSNEIINTSSEIADTLSLFDEQFSIVDLQNAIARNEDESNTVLSSVRRAVKKAAKNVPDEDKAIYVV